MKINDIKDVEEIVRDKFGSEVESICTANVLFIKVNGSNHKNLAKYIYDSIEDSEVKIVHRGYSIIGDDPVWIQVIKKQDNHFEIVES
jgi:hypothetical protein